MACECGIEGVHDIADHAERMFAKFRAGAEYRAFDGDARKRWEATAASIHEAFLARVGRGSQRSNAPGGRYAPFDRGDA